MEIFAIGLMYYFLDNNKQNGGMMAAAPPHIPGVGLRRLAHIRFKWGPGLFANPQAVTDWYTFHGGYLYRSKDDWYSGETGASSLEPIYLDQYITNPLSDEETIKINAYIRERRRRRYSNITDTEDLNEYESADDTEEDLNEYESADDAINQDF